MTPILIEWIDSIGSDGWVDLDAIDNDSMIITTLGYLIREQEDSYVVSSSVSQLGVCNAPIRIPKIAVLDVWKLEIK